MPEQQKTYKDARSAIGWLRSIGNLIFAIGLFATLYGAIQWLGAKEEQHQQIMNAWTVIFAGLGTLVAGFLISAFADIGEAVVDTAQNTAEIATLLRKEN